MVKEFLKILGKYGAAEEKAILPSELYHFWRYAQDFKLKKIVESGTYMGYTAIRLALLFPDCEIITYEKRPKRFREAKANCKPYPNIKCVNKTIDPRTRKWGKDTAVIIDGPKALPAIHMAFKLHQLVAFVAMHDMHEYVPIIKKKFKKYFFTGKAGELEKSLDKIKVPRRSGRYGHTLAIVEQK